MAKDHPDAAGSQQLDDETSEPGAGSSLHQGVEPGLSEDGGDEAPDKPRTVRLPFNAHAVRESRHILVEDLQARGVPDEIVGEAEMVLAELVSNALHHAKPLSDGCVRLHWKVKSPIVDLEVTDGGGSENEPRPIPEAPFAARGRGLRIVRSLAHEWGVNGDESGRTVWACLGGPSRRRTQ